MQSGVDLALTVGEDWSIYIEWLDIYGNPVASSAGSVAFMQVRNTSNKNLIVEFNHTNNPEVKAAATVLGTSGVIRLTCPTEISTALMPGVYEYDLVVKHMDEDRTLWATGQLTYVMTGSFQVRSRITDISALPPGLMTAVTVESN